MSAKKKKKLNKQKFIIFIVCIVIVVVFAVSIKNIVSLHLEHKQLVKQQAELNKEKKEKQKELENINDPSYVEEQARKQLKMVRPGEMIYIINDTDAVPKVKDNKDTDKDDKEKKTEEDKKTDENSKSSDSGE